MIPDSPSYYRLHITFQITIPFPITHDSPMMQPIVPSMLKGSQRSKDESLTPTIIPLTRSTPASPSNFQLIFDNALKESEEQTKKDLLTHPLAAKLQSCDSPSSILAVIQ